MKKLSYFLSIFMLACLTGCEDYNDKHFEGLDDMIETSGKFTKEYALTDEDYTTIGGLKVEEEFAKSLAAVKTNKYFTSELPVREILPSFLAKKWYAASAGSAVKVTYKVAYDAPEYLADLVAAPEYTLVAADYAAAWGDKEYAFFTPAKPAEKYLSKVLTATQPDAKEGDRVIVSYRYTASEPAEGNTPEEQFNTVEELRAAAEEGNYKLKGTVSAVHNQGFLLTDETGSVLVFMKAAHDYVIGDIVTVEGVTNTYNEFRQFTTPTVTKLGTDDEFVQPVAMELDGQAFTDYFSAPTVTRVSYVATVQISGNYTNFIVEGTGKQGSPAYYTVDASLNGQKVVVTGYAIGVASKGKFMQIMITSLEPLSNFETVTDVIAAETGDHIIRGKVVATHKQGFVVNDGTENIMVYKGSSFDQSLLQPGDVVTVNGAIEKRNNRNVQFKNTAEFTKVASSTYTYPAPEVMTLETMKDFLTTGRVKYATYSGVLKITGTAPKLYYNVELDGADPNTIQGSISYPGDNLNLAPLADKKITVTGYLLDASSNKYVNTMAVTVSEAGATPVQVMSSEFRQYQLMSQRTVLAAAPAIATEVRRVVYQFNGTSWGAEKNRAVINPTDYEEMGFSNSNFSESNAPEAYLPIYLTQKYPYAQEGDIRTVVYDYYDKEVSRKADDYKFTAGSWVLNSIAVEEVTEQYVFSTKWMYDPNVTLNFKYGSAYASGHFQKVIDWVKENKGETYMRKNVNTGQYYTDSEYYYGFSEYNNNIDIRVNTRKDYIEAYKDMTQEAIASLVMERIPEGIQQMLRVNYPDATPVAGLQVIYTVNFYTFNIEGADKLNDQYTIQFEVTGKGEFTYVENSLVKKAWE